MKPRSAAAKTSKSRYIFINSANYAVTRRAYQRAFGVALFWLILVFACAIEIGSAQTPPQVRINEVESNGGVPGDWFELYNAGATSFDLSGFKMLDNDDTHTPYVFPPGSIIAPGAYLVVEEAQFVFGLGAPDSVRIFNASGAPFDSYSWTVHATTTYGRCPNGTGPLTTTTSSTKGAANDCSATAGNSLVRINEVESNGGVPGDWVELHNPDIVAVNISGYVFKDNDDTHSYVIPAGTIIPAGGYYVLDEADFGFGLGQPDSARLFDTFGVLVDSFSWTVHAATTYGRCANGTGIFINTPFSTKNAANPCAEWPGGAVVQTADGLNVFGGNLSGLDYEGSGTSAPGVLWAVRNGPSTLFRLIYNGSIWTPDLSNSWGSGKTLLYPGGGSGSPDSEGVTFTEDSNQGLYVSTERDNNANTISRNSILRFDPSQPGPTLTATDEWNLTVDLPPTGANLGAEAITWIPDILLRASGFFDENKNHLYDPADYPNHGSGLFFVGLEANGNIYVYALDHSGNGAFNRIATISTGFPAVMDLQFDSHLGDLWAICDDTCHGISAVLRIDATGKFVVASVFQRPGPGTPNGMPDLNNEGFAITPGSECVNNARPVFWTDDSATGGHSIRSGTLTCTPAVNVTDILPPKAFPTASPAPNGAGWNTSDVTVTWNWIDNLGGSGIDPANCTTSTQSSGEASLTLNAACKDKAANTATGSYTVKVDKTDPIVVAAAKKADSTAYSFGSWTNQTVTVHYTCNDTVSLIAICSADQVFSVDGEFSTSGNAVDNAGRTASSGFVLVRVDKTLPALSITSPGGTSYENTAMLPIEWTASDSGSGIASQIATLDGKPVTKGQIIDLLALPLTTHTVKVDITDNAGNTSKASASFVITASVVSLNAAIDRFLAAGEIANAGIANSLKAKLGDLDELHAFLNELDAQLGKKVTQKAYDALKAGALFLMTQP